MKKRKMPHMQPIIIRYSLALRERIERVAEAARADPDSPLQAVGVTTISQVARLATLRGLPLLEAEVGVSVAK